MKKALSGFSPSITTSNVEKEKCYYVDIYIARRFLQSAEHFRWFI